MKEGRSDGCDTGDIFQAITEQELPRMYACCQGHIYIELDQYSLNYLTPEKKTMTVIAISF